MLQRAAKAKSRKAESTNWVRIAKTRERGPHPQTGEASDGEEHHTWEILLAEAKVDHQQLATLNRDITESEHQIAIEKAKKAA